MTWLRWSATFVGRVLGELLLLAALLLAAGGCGNPALPPDVDGGEPAPDAGAPDASSACADQSLTYASFGMAFLGTYCNRCHGFTQQIAQTSPGPLSSAAGTGTFMPPGTPKPSAQERTSFAAWLACGAP